MVIIFFIQFLLIVLWFQLGFGALLWLHHQDLGSNNGKGRTSMKLREESFKCPGLHTKSKELILYFRPQNGISHLAKKKGFREGFDFFQITTVDLFKSWNSDDCSRNSYNRASSKKGQLLLLI